MADQRWTSYIGTVGKSFFFTNQSINVDTHICMYTSGGRKN